MDLFFEQYFKNMQNQEFHKQKQSEENEVEIIYEEEAAPLPWMMRSSIYGKDLPNPELSDVSSTSSLGSPVAQRMTSFLVPSPLLRMKSPHSDHSNDPSRSFSPAPLPDSSVRSPSPALGGVLSAYEISQLPPLPPSPTDSPTALSDPSKQLNEYLELESELERANPADDSPIQGLGILYGSSVSPSPSQDYMNRTMWGLGNNLPEDDLILSDDSVGTKIHKNAAVLEDIAKWDYIHDSNKPVEQALFESGTEGLSKRASHRASSITRTDDPRFVPLFVPVAEDAHSGTSRYELTETSTLNQNSNARNEYISEISNQKSSEATLMNTGKAANDESASMAFGKVSGKHDSPVDSTESGQMNHSNTQFSNEQVERSAVGKISKSTEDPSIKSSTTSSEEAQRLADRIQTKSSKAANGIDDSEAIAPSNATGSWQYQKAGNAIPQADSIDSKPADDQLQRRMSIKELIQTFEQESAAPNHGSSSLDSKNMTSAALATGVIAVAAAGVALTNEGKEEVNENSELASLGTLMNQSQNSLNFGIVGKKVHETGKSSHPIRDSEPLMPSASSVKSAIVGLESSTNQAQYSSNSGTSNSIQQSQSSAPIANSELLGLDSSMNQSQDLSNFVVVGKQVQESGKSANPVEQLNQLLPAASNAQDKKSLLAEKTGTLSTVNSYEHTEALTAQAPDESVQNTTAGLAAVESLHAKGLIDNEARNEAQNTANVIESDTILARTIDEEDNNNIREELLSASKISDLSQVDLSNQEKRQNGNLCRETANLSAINGLETVLSGSSGPRTNRILQLLQEVRELIIEEQDEMHIILKENENLKRQLKK